MELLTAFGITADATANAAGAAREASAKGITTASQGSIDDLNGRFSAIQGHTFSIAESTKTLLINSSQQLARLAAIEFNTNELHAIRENMGVMREDMKHMRRGIDDMSLKGITLK